MHKATIIPRGRALGMVKFLPEGDRYSMKFIEYTSQLAIAMGGRVAEEIIFGKENITSGASATSSRRRKIARAMVTRLGYSDELGTCCMATTRRKCSSACRWDASRTCPKRPRRRSTRKFAVSSAKATEARRILTEKRSFVTVAQALLEYETLTGDEIKDLIHNNKPPRRDVTDEPPTPRSSSAVPTTAKPRPRPEPDAGLEPQPSA